MNDKQPLPPATIIMNFHNEGVYAQKSLLGFLRIREYSALRGNRVDLVCVLDNPNALTEQIICNFMTHYGTNHDQMIKTNFKNLSAARNAGIDSTKTDYLGFCDGDDFFSANRVEKMLLSQLNSQNSILCFPKQVISFDKKIESFELQDSDEIPLAQMMNHHFWVSSSFGHISTYQSHYFDESISKDSKFAYEDWDFHLRCIANGVAMKPIRDTYMFYRRKATSLLSEHHSYASFVPPSHFFN